METEVLEFTGERFTPECVREIYYEHWHRYAWAAERVGELNVLDAACGEGYGCRLLAEKAQRVVGVDIAPEVIEHAAKKYASKRIEFYPSSVLDLPFDDNTFDCIVSFETIEHLAEHDALLVEFRRVLKADGFLIISSPDKKHYSDDTGFENEHHVRELYREEFEALLTKHFGHYRMFGQKLQFQSMLQALDDTEQPLAEALVA
ncbi:MAG: class I SAM-dependent methyltransferase, partial [Symploca sp. SIO2G7]|nr:class I SAM-dependent methyltransferase [Symploca sp. SIO2G7]